MSATATQSDVRSHGIRVQTESVFVGDQSDPRNHLYVFAYRITITNEGARPATLMSRHWVITDGIGQVDEVRGPGVVGEHPRLAPGESFEYTSGCPLRTRIGTMRGEYRMVEDDGSAFEAKIGPFALLHKAILN